MAMMVLTDENDFIVLEGDEYLVLTDRQKAKIPFVPT
jgi:hypothetical protein